MGRIAILAVVLALLGGCDNAEKARQEETRAALVGTWLSEAELDDGFRLRRVTVLERAGSFVEHARDMAPGSEQQWTFAGEWTYDGSNFKQRYLQENGRQFSGGKMRFSTQALRSVSAREFVTRDGGAGREIAYHRVAEGTQP